MNDSLWNVRPYPTAKESELPPRRPRRPVRGILLFLIATILLGRLAAEFAFLLGIIPLLGLFFVMIPAVGALFVVWMLFSIAVFGFVANRINERDR